VRMFKHADRHRQCSEQVLFRHTHLLSSCVVPLEVRRFDKQ